ncbi:hypothetical protein Q8A67_000013 [Cirrhinus molitorella]|uniref:Uncharacterized protein n=1 Tax=Cirrhinus molitorella TaxID=172907 RepID=A0AA88TYD7_9TELE|nr:hypothetical protein Q8A67_000013 [Cirrhinus molitorella]
MLEKFNQKRKSESSENPPEARGYVHTPPVEESVAVHLCPAAAKTLGSDISLPSKPCRTTAHLANKAYAADAHGPAQRRDVRPEAATATATAPRLPGHLSSALGRALKKNRILPSAAGKCFCVEEGYGQRRSPRRDSRQPVSFQAVILTA